MGDVEGRESLLILVNRDSRIFPRAKLAIKGYGASGSLRVKRGDSTLAVAFEMYGSPPQRGYTFKRGDVNFVR